jgi:glutamate synthase (NADPH/NADH) small chain
MGLHVVDEAKRCLKCDDPLCMEQGCPIRTPVPHIVRAFLAGEINSAGKMLFDNNPLSLFCSLICDYEKQCEGHCVQNKDGTPIHISSIENYISDNYLEKWTPAPTPRNGGRIGIIGSGPAGLTIAIMLAQRGYDITLFESKDKIGGVLRYGIPDFRLPKVILDKFEEKLIGMGIKIRPNTSIGTVIGVDDMIRDGYDALFLGTGVWKPNALSVGGQTLGNVHFAINYLSNPDVYHLGDRVIVIGAGNAAMDVARTALRKGAGEVTVLSRADKVAASNKQYEYAKVDGVRFEYSVVPVEITGDGVYVQYCGSAADNGRGNEDGAASGFFPADSVIISVGQGPRNRIVSTTKGIDIKQNGLLVTNRKGSTTREGVFASGDVVLGAKSVVEAVAYSKQVAESMDRYVKAKKGFPISNNCTVDVLSIE